MVAFGDPRLPAPFDVACEGDEERLKGQGRWADARNWAHELTRAYRLLARGEGFDPRAAWIVGHILSDAAARAATFGLAALHAPGGKVPTAPSSIACASPCGGFVDDASWRADAAQ